MSKQIIYNLLFITQALLLISTAHAQQYLLGPVLWSDTTIQVVEAGSDEPDSVNVSVAYVANLDLKVLARSRNSILDFLKSIDRIVPTSSNWNTYVDSTCNVTLQYPVNYSIKKLTQPTDPCYAIHLATKISSELHRKKKQPVGGLTLYSTSRRFLEELSQLGLDIQNENDLFRSTMASPVFLQSNTYKAVYWQNNRLESDGAGTMFAQSDEMFFVFIECSPGSAMTVTVDPGIIPLIIASTVKVIN